jgi:hypothetical protein
MTRVGPPDDSSSVFDELLADAVHEPPLLVPGTKLASGRFVVRSVLGTGGMGAVYRATDTRRGRDVAVKVLSRVEAAGIYALKQEFRSLSNVDHPNLVRLHELHSDRGTWFLSMDLVDGQPLSQARRPIPLLREVFSQIAEAIHAIHQLGKLHRDLKPSNVMITPARQVVLLDFGLVADQEPGGPGQTLAGDGLAGTPTYMAPELSTGPATPKSDWYALGTMLYEALFGRPPFREAGVAALVRKREEPASRPPVARGEVPRDLEDLCMRLLERDPASRPGYPEITAVLGTAETPGRPSHDPERDPFVGREGELQILEQALLETDQGKNAVVTVSGSPGVGKTRLVKRFVELARQDLGGVVLSGRCPKWEHVPFRACDSLIDDLSRYLRALPTERAASVLPRNMPALTQVFPVLGRLPAVRAIRQRRSLPREPSEIRRLGLAALRDLLGNIAAQERLVVFVDDMHWSDLDGARLLASLLTPAAQADTPAMLLIVAHRDQQGGNAPGLTAFLDRMSSNPNVHVKNLELRGLSPAESHRLATELLGGPRGEIEDRIALEGGGNPLFIRQLIRHVLESSADAGPLDLEGVLATRIARLEPRERVSLAAVCLTGQPVTLSLLSQITDEPDPESCARNLESAQLARFVSGPTHAVAAYHDRVREVVVSGMDASERSRLHARSVEALEKAADPDLVALTLHYLGCGRERDAAASAVTAAGSALSVLAFEQAAAMYRLALDHGQWGDPGRIDLLVRLAEALALDRRSGEAAAQFLNAASLETDGAKRGTLRLRAADQYLAGGWLGEGIGLLRDIFAEVGLDYDAIASSNLFELRKRLAQRQLTIAPQPQSEIPAERLARLDALFVAGNGLAWLKAESTQFRFALALEALDAGQPLRLARGLRTVARFDAQLDPDNDEVYGVVRRICEEHPGIQSDLILSDLDSAMALVRGRPWDQYQAARHSEQLLMQHPTQDARVLDVARFHQATALCIQGEVQELNGCWGWLQDAEDRADLFLGCWLNVLLASQCIARGRPDAAREMCHKASRMWAAVADMQDSALSIVYSETLSACEAYEGGGSVYDPIRTASGWFDHSPLRMFPFISCHFHCMRATAALACLEQPGPGAERQELLRDFETSIAMAARPRGLDGRESILPHYRTVSTLLSAGLAALRGDTESALRALDTGLGEMSTVGSYAVRSAHARRAKGLLLGGTTGKALCARAEADLRSLGVKDPARHARAFLPGFDGANARWSA